jgi:hypothetical protein
MIQRKQNRRRTQSQPDRFAHDAARVDLPCVLFDLDGTLIDSVYHHVITWSEALDTAGIVFPKWKIP